jgi:hypothetical protein
VDALESPKIVGLGAADHEVIDLLVAHKRKTLVRRLPSRVFG